MRDPNPVSNVPDADRYRGNGAASTPDRYGELRGRGPAGTFNHVGVTLEEEAEFGGWLPNDRPTTTPPFMQGNDARLTQSMAPRDLFTVGMRGESGYDDDPQFQPDGQVTHNDN